MAKLNRTEIIKRLYKVLKKRFSPVPAPSDRNVLEHLLFACCLEDARHEQAEECFARLQQTYFDWNEIRVTTTRELSEALTGLPEPLAAAARLKTSLQSVFENRYEFDLEFLKKLKLGEAQKKLSSMKGPSGFVQAYLTQVALGGHAIPLCSGSLQALIVVGAATATEASEGSVPGLERAISKNQGIEFGSLLHSLGAQLVAEPYGNATREIFLEISPDSADRLQKRPVRRPQTGSAGPAAGRPLPGKAAGRSAPSKTGSAKSLTKPAGSTPKTAGNRTQPAERATERGGAGKPSASGSSSLPVPGKKSGSEAEATPSHPRDKSEAASMGEKHAAADRSIKPVPADNGDKTKTGKVAKATKPAQDKPVPEGVEETRRPVLKRPAEPTVKGPTEKTAKKKTPVPPTQRPAAKKPAAKKPTTKKPQAKKSSPGGKSAHGTDSPASASKSTKQLARRKPR